MRASGATRAPPSVPVRDGLARRHLGPAISRWATLEDSGQAGSPPRRSDRPNQRRLNRLRWARTEARRSAFFPSGDDLDQVASGRVEDRCQTSRTEPIMITAESDIGSCSGRDTLPAASGGRSAHVAGKPDQLVSHHAVTPRRLLGSSSRGVGRSRCPKWSKAARRRPSPGRQTGVRSQPGPDCP